MSATISPFRAERTRFVEDLLGYMTLPEKLGQLIMLNYPDHDHAAPFLQRIRTGGAGTVARPPDRAEARNLQALAVEQTRLGIPLLFLEDITALDLPELPEPIAMAASWDEESAARAAGPAAIEARERGVNWLRTHPKVLGRNHDQSRVSQSYGSDPYLAARIGLGRVGGLQGSSLGAHESVLALVADGARGRIGRDLADRMMRDRRVASISGSKLQRGDRTRFGGIDLAEWRAILAEIGSADGIEALARAAEEAIAKNRLSPSRIDDAVGTVIVAKYDLGLFRDPFAKLTEGVGDPGSPEAMRSEIAIDAARRSMVLLRNEQGILPLSSDSGEILVVGSQDGAARSVCQGLDQFGVLYRQASGLSRQRSERDPAALTEADALAIAIASDAAKRARSVLLALGRGDFVLRGQDLPLIGPAARALLKALAMANSRVGVIVSAPWPVDLGEDIQSAAALLLAWERSSGLPTALGEVLTGEFNPAGRLPMPIPGGKAGLAFPLGHGLSYSRFTYSNFTIELEADGFAVEADLANRGALAGTETAQLYVGGAGNRRGRVCLRGFQRITLAPDEVHRLRFELGREELGEIGESNRLTVEPGRYELRIGPNAAQCLSGEIDIGQPLAKAITLRGKAGAVTSIRRAAEAG